MVDHSNIGASTIQKCVDIVCDVLTNRGQFFKKYINTPSRNQLRLMIQEFQELESLLNICGSIDEIHIPLAKRVTLKQNGFFKRKKLHNIVLQKVCGVHKWFSKVCWTTRMMVVNFRFSIHTKKTNKPRIFSRTYFMVRGVRCIIYIIKDSTYWI